MKHKFLDSSIKYLQNEYTIDAVKDIILIHENRIYAYLKADEEPLSFHVISGELSTLGFENKPVISIREIFDRFDYTSRYSEVAGKIEYYENNYRDCIDLTKNKTISIPILKNNKRIWLRIERVILEKDKSIQAVFISDSTRYLLEEEKIFIKTHRDALTDVFNRYTLDYHYGVRYHFDNFHAMYLDLDDFKIANDRLGHEVGDRYLREFASILLSYEKDYTRFYRIGGDEFVALVFEPEAVVKQIAFDIVRKTQELSTRFPGLDTTVSIGIVKATIREDVIRKADEVLYKVKTNGKNGFQYEVET